MKRNYLHICSLLQICIILHVLMLLIPLEYILSMMSIILYHYKMLKERTSSFGGFDGSSNDDQIMTYTTIIISRFNSIKTRIR